MKRLILALSVVLLAGCNSEPAVTELPVVTAKPSTTIAAPPTTRRVTTTTKKKTAITTTTSKYVYYANCADVRAAGAAPLHEGDPGYSSSLDRDGDGVACE